MSLFSTKNEWLSPYKTIKNSIYLLRSKSLVGLRPTKRSFKTFSFSIPVSLILAIGIRKYKF